jgi:hypothetical protein
MRVGVCASAAIETKKRRERASHGQIHRVIIRVSIEKSSPKEK